MIFLWMGEFRFRDRGFSFFVVFVFWREFFENNLELELGSLVLVFWVRRFLDFLFSFSL